jgi:hypothetical protein
MTTSWSNVSTDDHHSPPTVLGLAFILTWEVDGFFLNRNEWDAIYLDDIIFRDLTTSQEEELREQQYEGYVTRVFFFLLRSSFPFLYIVVAITTYSHNCPPATTN